MSCLEPNLLQGSLSIGRGAQLFPRVWFPHIFFTRSLKLALETTDMLEENHRR